MTARWRMAALAAIGLAAGAQTSGAQAKAGDPAYLGTWVIAEAHPAPWFEPKDPGTAPFDDHIVGKLVTFTATRIIAPAPLSCRRPAYKLTEVPPDYLFQGGLTRPAAQAATLGFGGAKIRTLETNCNAGLEYHFTDAGTALIGLNNNIYTLRRR